MRLRSKHARLAGKEQIANAQYSTVCATYRINGILVVCYIQLYPVRQAKNIYKIIVIIICGLLSSILLPNLKAFSL